MKVRRSPHGGKDRRHALHGHREKHCPDEAVFCDDAHGTYVGKSMGQEAQEVLPAIDNPVR